jgi:hypothetical protein
MKYNYLQTILSRGGNIIELLPVKPLLLVEENSKLTTKSLIKLQEITDKLANKI